MVAIQRADLFTGLLLSAPALDVNPAEAGIFLVSMTSYYIFGHITFLIYNTNTEGRVKKHECKWLIKCINFNFQQVHCKENA